MRWKNPDDPALFKDNWEPMGFAWFPISIEGTYWFWEKLPYEVNTNSWNSFSDRLCWGVFIRRTEDHPEGPVSPHGKYFLKSATAKYSDPKHMPPGE